MFYFSMDIIKNIGDIPKNGIKKIANVSSGVLKLSKIRHKSNGKIGKSPGELVYVGKKRDEKVKIQIIDYTKDKLNEFETEDVKDVFKFRDKKSVTWINVTGVHDLDVIKKIGEHFKLHPLLLEDVVNTNQRPKIEEFENDLFIVLRMISFDDESKTMKSNQLSLVLGKGFIISFQEKQSGTFESIRKRIREKRKTIRESGADYLCYALVDVVVDNYFLVLDRFGEQIENIEGSLIKDIDSSILNLVYGMKRELIILRKSVWPLREVISSLQRDELKFIEKKNQAYLRDVYDHTIQVIDTVETYRDMLSGMLDLYMSVTGNKMNEVMKVLTIIATIFIPLTFIAGIYGMNFEFMPELSYRYAYFIVLGLMILVGFIMLVYFRKRKWI